MPASPLSTPSPINLFPSLITRYVLWELAKIFIVSSVAFVTLMVVIGVADKAADNGLGPDIVLRLVPYILPEAMMFAMPATCLFSVCVVFGRLAADNELIALQAVGLKKSTVIIPALVLTFLLSLFAVWINDVSFAWGYWGIKRVVLECSDKIVYSMLESEGSFKGKQFSIEVDGVDQRRLIRPVITINSSNNQRVRTSAAEARLSIHPTKHALNLALVDGIFDAEGKASMQFDDVFNLEIPLSSPKDLSDERANPTHLYLSQIGQQRQQQEQNLRRLRAQHASMACGNLMLGDLVGLTTHQWQQRLLEQEKAERRLGRLNLVPHRRWASGFSCLAFAVIGIPVATKLRSANYATTFGACFLPILVLYYPLFMFGLTGAKEGNLPPLAAWLGNAVCMLVGIVLLSRTNK